MTVGFRGLGLIMIVGFRGLLGVYQNVVYNSVHHNMV